MRIVRNKGRVARVTTEQPQNLWDGGDYPELAVRLMPAAESIVDAAGPGRGRPAADLAAGTGSVALGLARAGWRVTATDWSARMVELGRASSTGAGRVVEWQQADLTDQPMEDSSQSLVTSSFGVIFAADPAAVVSETARILGAGGRLLATTWADDGYMAAMTQRMMAYVPGAPPSAPHAWGSPDWVRHLLAEHYDDIAVEPRTLPWSFPSARDGRCWLERVSPAHIAAMAAAGEQAEAMMDAVEEHLGGFVGDDGTVSVDAEYYLVSGRRKN